MIKIGAPLDYVLFKEGGVITSTGALLGIMERPPSPDASKIFINWLLSREGQALVTQIADHMSWRLDVPTAYINPINMPRPGVHYIEDTVKFYKAWPETMRLAREIFVLRTP